MGLFEKIFGSYSAREIKRIMPIVKKINALEPEMIKLSDSELKDKTEEFKDRLVAGETLDDLLPEAFAVVREASKRVLEMRHFDVQLIGGIVLHQGRIAEMKTGEGKTLVATLPCYLNALTGKGVHVVTVNDYLARRDSEQMGKIHRFLGLEVGLIVPGQTPEEKRAAYNADITYATNNELGFDYLRDNMVIYKEQIVCREHNFAIVDEVDSILIDEARTPLIISGMGDKSTELYSLADRFARTLKKKVVVEEDTKVFDDASDADYIIDEKAKTVTLTPQGVKKAEAAFSLENLYDSENMTIAHHINQAIRAHGIMHRDRDYVVKDGEVIIVDEFTGRLMIGRRYSDGLHQAIEAKEGVEVARESKTLATITFQNFFRLYSKLSGMTGTALTEEVEFQQIYKLDSVEIPTNEPMVRIDHPDAVYKSEKGKLNAVVNQIEECNKKGQPVLVGTVTIDKSELISSMLKRRGIKHEVLNAKYHEKEAEIIAQAGKKGAVTIATNMAGPGSDIMLGGNADYLAKQKLKKMGYEDDIINESMGFAETDNELVLEARENFARYKEEIKPEIMQERELVKQAGGLFIIGTERHESRRIDNQLRGRAGRQGDVGESRFYISLEDDLMRLFGTDRLISMVDRLGLGEEDAIEANILSGAIENAQKRVEGRNFQIREHVLKYDDVMNVQRNVIYGERQKVLNGENIHPSIEKMISSFIDETVEYYCSDEYVDNWNLQALSEAMSHAFDTPDKVEFTRDMYEDLTKESIKEIYQDIADKKYQYLEQEFGSNVVRDIERMILLRVVDSKWMNHIDDMDQLRQGIGLRAYAQRDPAIEYKEEGYAMYEAMLAAISEEVTKTIFRVRKSAPVERKQVATPVVASHGDGTEQKKPVTRSKEKVGRNDPCPCGSGKKYKKCCGQ